MTKTEAQQERRFYLIGELARLSLECPDDADAITRFVYDLTLDSPCLDPNCIFCESTDADDFVRRVSMLRSKPNRG